MANAASNHIKYLLATGAVNFLTDVFNIILMESGYAFNKDTHEAYSDVVADELANGFGYTTGGNVLGGVSLNEDDTDDRTEITWSNSSWTAAGGDIGPVCGAIILDMSADPYDPPVVGYIDFGATYTQADTGTAVISGIEVRIK